MAVRIYVDALSQPARALMLFVRCAGIPFEEKRISIAKLEHKTEEYKKINPFCKIPALDHDGFLLTESVAIVRYLSRAFPVKDHWYPKDPQKQAAVDEYLEYQHLNTRIKVTRYFVSILFPGLLGLPGPDEKFTKKMQKSMEDCLDEIERTFLKKNPFIAGQDISIADLLAVGELEEPKLVNYDVRDERPIIKAYLDRVQDRLNPHYDEVHKALHKFQKLRQQAADTES